MNVALCKGMKVNKFIPLITALIGGVIGFYASNITNNLNFKFQANNENIMTVLEILSVLGGVVLAWIVLVQICKKRTAKRETAGKSKDFVYELVKSHSRWLKIGTEYIKYRELKVLANVSGISEMKIGVGPTSEASFEIKSLTPSIKLDCINPTWINHISENYRVIFPSPLTKGETLLFRIRIHGVAKRGKTLPSCFTFVEN